MVDAAPPPDDDGIPHNIDLERMVLGSCLLHPEYVAACAGLPPDLFFRDYHRNVMQALLDMRAAGRAITVVTVWQWLQAHGTDDGSSPALLASMADGLPLPKAVSFQQMLDEIRDVAARRAMVGIGIGTPQVVRAAASATAAGEALVGQIQNALQGIDAGACPISDYAFAAVAAPQPGSVYYTHWPKMDNIGAVPRLGELLAVCARPGHGKTAVGLSLTAGLAQAGVRVGYMSLEMTGVSLFQRLLAARAGHSLSDLRAHGVEDNQEVMDVAGEIAEWPIDIVPGRTVDALRRHILQTPDCRIVVVDYLQLMAPPALSKHYGSRTQEVTAISAAMRELASEGEVAVVVLAQLNREVERRGDAEPRLSDMRESGAVEQDADVVWGLYRPALSPMTAKADEAADWELNCRVLKHRNGPTGGRVKLHFVTSTQAIFESETQTGPSDEAFEAEGDHGGSS